VFNPPCYAFTQFVLLQLSSPRQFSCVIFSAYPIFLLMSPIDLYILSLSLKFSLLSSHLFIYSFLSSFRYCYWLSFSFSCPRDEMLGCFFFPTFPRFMRSFDPGNEIFLLDLVLFVLSFFCFVSESSLAPRMPRKRSRSSFPFSTQR